jgi:hypothetical protein
LLDKYIRGTPSDAKTRFPDDRRKAPVDASDPKVYEGADVVPFPTRMFPELLMFPLLMSVVNPVAAFRIYPVVVLVKTTLPARRPELMSAVNPVAAFRIYPVAVPFRTTLLARIPELMSNVKLDCAFRMYDPSIPVPDTSPDTSRAVLGFSIPTPTRSPEMVRRPIPRVENARVPARSSHIPEERSAEKVNLGYD